jgi:hypothetical protein
LPDRGKARGYDGGKRYGAPQVLTPPGAQRPAPGGKPEKSKRLAYESFATHCNTLFLARNEQVSGSSSLVGTYFYLHLQVKHKDQETSKVPYRCP